MNKQKNIMLSGLAALVVGTTPVQSETVQLYDYMHIQDVLDNTPLVEGERNVLVLPTGNYKDENLAITDLVIVPQHWDIQGNGNGLMHMLRLEGNNTIDGVVRDYETTTPGITGFHIVGSNVLIKDCVVNAHNQYSGSKGVYCTAQGGVNNVVQDCTFENLRIGIGNIEGSGLTVRNCVMRNNFYGVFSKGDMDLGNTNGSKLTDAPTEEGENVIIYNNNLGIVLNGTVSSAEGNFWYDGQGNLLTDEASILAGFVLQNTTKTTKDLAESIDVVPFKTVPHPDYPLASGVADWETYR
jgi:hypothetical protein